MKTDQYSILFSSLTGNTKKLADAIHETLPKMTVSILVQSRHQYHHQNYCISDFGQIREMLTTRH